MTDEKLTKPLRTPIQAHGEEVSELAFRAPTSLDLIEIGSPVRVDMASEPPGIIFDEKKFMSMMSRLAAVPPSSIQKMHPTDFLETEWLLTPFFVPRPGMI